MVTEMSKTGISDYEKVGKMKLKSAVLMNRISMMTSNFFIAHSRNVTDQEWSQLIDGIVEIVNAQRS